MDLLRALTMENLGIKIALLALIVFFLYREITKSITSPASKSPKTKAGLFSLFAVGTVVSGFVYLGISFTSIETRDLRPIIRSPQFVSIYDPGVIELDGMFIKTNLARRGELRSLADRLGTGCNGNDGCEISQFFDYVTHIPYKTDHTSRHPSEVIASNWGDCDDKSNLFASLLQERGYEYRFVYVPHHVFVVVHIQDRHKLPFLSAKLNIEGKDFYYAETTSTGAKIGDFNGQFPYQFKGIYDIQHDKEVNLDQVAFRLG